MRSRGRFMRKLAFGSIAAQGLDFHPHGFIAGEASFALELLHYQLCALGCGANVRHRAGVEMKSANQRPKHIQNLSECQESAKEIANCRGM
jgi:hypothetical protein